MTQAAKLPIDTASDDDIQQYGYNFPDDVNGLYADQIHKN